MIRALLCSLQALTVIVLSRNVFLALSDLDYLGLTPNGLPSAEIATALQVEYTGLHKLIHETQPLPAISRDFIVGSFGIEDLTNIVRDSPLDGAAALADGLEAFRTDARTTAQHLRTFQLKVDGLADRVFTISSIILQTLEIIPLTSRELMACNVIQFVATSSSKCQAVLRFPSTFQAFFNMLEVGIEVLIVQAIELETSLSRLDERLDTVREFAIGEAKLHLLERDRILAGAWTQFGANNQRISLLDQNLRTLEVIHEHRRFADSCASRVQSELQAMKTSLESLRPLASSLSLYGVGPSTGPVMREIKAGVERLNNRDTKDLEMTGFEIGVWDELKPSDVLYSEA